MNWHKYPMLRVIIALMAGIVVSSYTPSVSAYVYGGLFVISAFSILFPWRTFIHFDSAAHIKSASILLCFLFFGAFRYGIDTNTLPAQHFSHYIPSGMTTLSGIILEQPKVRNRARTTIQVTSILDSLDVHRDSEGTLVAYFESEDTSALYKPGDQIAFYCRIDPTLANTNPYAFDYKDYLHNRGIDHQAFVREGNHHLLREKQLHPIYQKASNIRVAALGIIDTYIPINDRKAVVSAMLLGYRNNITPELYQSYTDTGVVHVLAVSGLHVGIIAAMLFWIMNWIPSKYTYTKVAKAVIVILLLAAYVLITGAAPAVVRAAIMMTFILLSAFLKDGLNIFNSLAVSAFLMLAYDPGMFYQASFQFSFLALTSIVFFQPILSKVWVPKTKPVQWAWGLSLVAISAQILVFPLTIFYFHKFPMYFMLSGIVAIPAATAIIYGGVALLLSAVVLPHQVTLVVAWLLSHIIWLFNYLIELIHSLPGTVAGGLWAEQSTMLLMYVFIGCCMFFLTRDYKYRYLKYASVTLLTMVTLTSFRTAKSHHQTFVTIYDMYNSYAIDFVDGMTVYAITDSTLSSEKHHFAVHNNRIKHGTRYEQDISTEAYVTGDQFARSKSLYHLGNLSIYVIDSLMPTAPLDVDILVVSHASKVPPEVYMKHITTRQVIVDNSLKYWLAKPWAGYCSSHNIRYRNVATEGAITIDAS